MDSLHHKASEALSLRIEAEEKVRKDEKIEIAKKAIKKSFDYKTIAEITGLAVEQIQKL